MKAAIVAARILLGLIFFVFGLKRPPPISCPCTRSLGMPAPSPRSWPSTAGGQFVSVLQVIGGLLLLVGRYVPLGLVILSPIIVNILLFHALLTGGEGIVPGLVCAILALFLIWVYRLSFRGLFDAAARGVLASSHPALRPCQLWPERTRAGILTCLQSLPRWTRCWRAACPVAPGGLARR